MVVDSGDRGFDTLDLTSKVGDCLVKYASPAVYSGKRVATGVEVVFFLEVMAV